MSQGITPEEFANQILDESLTTAPVDEMNYLKQRREWTEIKAVVEAFFRDYPEDWKETDEEGNPVYSSTKLGDAMEAIFAELKKRELGDMVRKFHVTVKRSNYLTESNLKEDGNECGPEHTCVLMWEK